MRSRLFSSLLTLLVAACGPSGDTWSLGGECDAPSGSSPIDTQASLLVDSNCFQSSGDLHVVTTTAEWDALFTCPTPLPAGIDLATSRAAVVSVSCSPTDFRFAAETATEHVVGIHTGVSGACLGDVLVVPLPTSTKTVRLAYCYDECHGSCPPVP